VTPHTIEQFTSVQRTLELRGDPDASVRALNAAPAPAPAPALASALLTPTALPAPAMNAAALGFSEGAILASMLLETCPSAAVLEFKSELGRELKGREIIYHFQEGWFRGRILKQADNMRIKSNGRPCNYRVFYEADDEFLNQALYPETYASDASAPVDGWMLVGGFEPHALALATSPAPPLALLGPADSLDALD
jgi:hypothetical protein